MKITKDDLPNIVWKLRKLASELLIYYNAESAAAASELCWDVANYLLEMNADTNTKAASPFDLA